jgi:hypothetical protein
MAGATDRGRRGGGGLGSVARPQIVRVGRFGPRATGAAGLRFWTGTPRREVGDPRAQTLQPPADIGEVCILDWGMHCILEGDVAEEAAEDFEHLLDLHLGREEPVDVVVADAGAVLGSKYFAPHD